MKINSDIHTSIKSTNQNTNKIKQIDLDAKDPFDLDLRIEAKRIQQVVPDATPYCGSDGDCTGCGCNTCCSSC